MKISAIPNIRTRYQINKNNTQKNDKQNQVNDSIKTNSCNYRNFLPFLGNTIHIFDGDNHLKNMEHFAKAISKDSDIVIHEVEVNEKYPEVKQIKSLYEQLKKLPPEGNGEYVAIPVLFTVALQNLKEQYEKHNKEELDLNPQSVTYHKQHIIGFSGCFSSFKDAMDPNCQGIEWIGYTISQINKLVEGGYKVYIPAGHPEHQSLKWLAEQKGKKEELNYYLSHRQDIDNSVKDMKEYIEKQGWYDFNLLTLSKANIINIKDANNYSDFIYAAHDARVTDSARGVYNFYPIRDKSDKVIGFSYTDKETVQYPYEEYEMTQQVEHILNYTGKKLDSVLADEKTTEDFVERERIGYIGSKKDFSKYLFRIEDVFSDNEIKAKKLYLKGKFVDSTLKTFYNVNDDNEVTFENCNCEASQRPSVVSMWGTCFSVFTAIQRDIEERKEGEEAWKNYKTYKVNGEEIAFCDLDKKRHILNELIKMEYEDKNYERVKKLACEILRLRKVAMETLPEGIKNPEVLNDNNHDEIFRMLIDILKKEGNLRGLKEVLEYRLYELCKYRSKNLYRDFQFSRVPDLLRVETRYIRDLIDKDAARRGIRPYEPRQETMPVSSEERKKLEKFFKQHDIIAKALYDLADYYGEIGDYKSQEVYKTVAADVHACEVKGTTAMIKIQDKNNYYLHHLYDKN